MNKNVEFVFFMSSSYKIEFELQNRVRVRKTSSKNEFVLKTKLYSKLILNFPICTPDYQILIGCV
jgi:hypothetical protein